MALLGQVEMTRVDAVEEFKVSQMFIDSCVIYYGSGFEDCLKQVKSVYPSLDLSKVSKVTMDNPLPSTPASDTTLGESDDSTKSELDQKDDSVVLAQPAVDPPVTPSVSSTEPLNVENPLVQDIQDKTDENPQDAPTSLS